MLKDMTKKEIKDQYLDNCWNYINALLEGWKRNEQGYWLGDVNNGTYYVDDDTPIKIEEIRYCVDNGVTMEEYLEYLRYNSMCLQFQIEGMKLDKYMEKGPVFSEDDFSKIEEMRSEMYKEIERLKNKTAGGQ